MYTLSYEDKKFELNEQNLAEFNNDDEKPVSGIEPIDIIKLLSEQANLDFEIEYFNRACQVCFAGKEEKAKYFTFLVYSFYLYTKDGTYVMSNLSKEYEGKSFSKLLNAGIVDDSYCVSVLVCDSCGKYTIEILQCDI
ncbi:DUF3785 family protein [Desulfuribacillus alkaliarsenatis]|uniref:DUF3785 domain-containing protein n=1 Tax=Desulfuribacillus alkaliarsenatis TaxID=766136 RepID=A0A1E5G2Z5_9FIRM|nr:DUF3785 family protein [Desulfuribacillus alkaliarsenatis]OEF97438.1 hypothetical protein BHF68_04305 [Desulfuribacillus alkaliarsenatis]